MNNESPPESSRRASGGEFTWPPTREELDAIEVIRLDDTTSVEPRAVAPAKTATVAPAIGRRGRLRLPRRLPRRDDLVFAGVLGTSLMAIAAAASMQFSDLWRPASGQAAVPVPPRAGAQPVQSELLDPIDPRVGPIAPLIAQALPVTSPITTAPVATFTSAPAPASGKVTDARPRAAARAVDRRRAVASRSAAYARRSATHMRLAADARPASHARRDEPEGITRPRLIAPEGGRSGKIVLIVEVRKNGKVGDVDVLSSDLDRKNRSHRDLQRAAISAVKRWRYEPAIRDGAPADTRVRVVVDINLDSSRVAFTGANARRRAAAASRAADSVLAAR